MGKSRLLYGAALLGVLIFHTYYTRWFSWYLLMLLLFLPWFSLLCSIHAMLRLRLRAQMPASCMLAQPASIRLGSQDPKLLAPPFCFQVVILDQMEGTSCRQKIYLSGAKTAQVELPTHHAGSYVCSLEKGRVYDYLGLFRLPLRLPELGELLVWPEEKAPAELPSLSELSARAFRAKTAGGFSEIHDLRPYHAGDSMRDVHWKLSAKTDELIVREPLEPVRGQAIVSFDLAGSRDMVDRTLGRLQWICRWLLSQELSHTVCWLDPASFAPQSAFLGSQDDLQTLMERLLRTGLQDGTPSIASKSFPAADWRYHVRPDDAEVRA